MLALEAEVGELRGEIADLNHAVAALRAAESFYRQLLLPGQAALVPSARRTRA